MPLLSRRTVQQKVHDLLCAGIRRTPPLRIVPAPVTILSMVSARDLLMYLGAIKSFYAQFGQGRVCVINDGSLTAGHLDLLKENVPGVDLVHIDDAPRRKVPKGGTWERLLYMVELSRDSYVIQLDADTLTRAPIEEVREAVRTGRPFIISGDRDPAQIQTRQAVSALARLSASQHVQVEMERRLADIDTLKPCYVRGCSAFFGLPAGLLSLDEVEEWSQTMEAVLGRRWTEWGTEQASANYLLANLPGTLVLQSPKYTHRWRERPADESAFIHFIGSNRFDKQYYARETRKTIRALKAPLPARGMAAPSLGGA